MKLPGARIGGVPSLGRPDVYRPLRTAGGQELATAKFLQDMAGVVRMYEQDKAAAQMQEAANNFLADEIAWREQNLNKEFYNVDEIPDGLGINKYDAQGNPRDLIPAYEVQPAMYENMLRDSMDRNAGIIEMGRARNDWTSKYNNWIQKSSLDMQLKAVDEQNRQNDAKSLLQAEDAAAMKNYGMAEANINNVSDPVVRERELRLLRQKMETDNYDEMIMNGTAQELNSTADLIEDPVEYERYGGRLDTGARMAYASKMRSQAAAIDKQNSSATKLEKAYVTRMANETAYAMAVQGKNMDPKKVAELAARAQVLDISGEAQLKLALAMEYAPRLQAFGLMPIAQQETILRDLQGATDTPEGQIVYGLYAARFDYIEQQANQDMMQLVSDSGMDIAPLDFQSPDAFAVSLAARQKPHDTGYSTYGKSQGFLTGAEADQLAMIFDAADDNTKLAYAQAIYEGLGPANATFFYEQFKEKGMGTFVVAGQLVAQGQTPIAQALLSGNRYRRESGAAGKEILKNQKSDFDPEITTVIGGAYRFNGKQTALYTQAIKDLYIDMSTKAGDFTGELDEDRLEEAITAITGGIVEYNGYQIEAPTRGMGNATFDRWMERLEPEYFTVLGGVEGVENSLVLERLKSGQYQLISQGSNQYAVDNGFGQFLAATGGKQQFIFRYDPEAPLKPPAGRRRRTE